MNCGGLVIEQCRIDRRIVCKSNGWLQWLCWRMIKHLWACWGIVEEILHAREVSYYICLYTVQRLSMCALWTVAEVVFYSLLYRWSQLQYTCSKPFLVKTNGKMIKNRKSKCQCVAIAIEPFLPLAVTIWAPVFFSLPRASSVSVLDFCFCHCI